MEYPYYKQYICIGCCTSTEIQTPDKPQNKLEIGLYHRHCLDRFVTENAQHINEQELSRLEQELERVTTEVRQNMILNMEKTTEW